ncbi:hypothetical protein LTR48_006264 [Friedmanniomyces endolithicus]|uniref:Uncharacterized protein n=1 Tax=Rachicladosporium monterosium TaxID=1507873 RepID=A0ABR0L5I3_9PEZI|nr:hypothetical protein LTR48_006264 [Friedmanniomyces endolithicus]KAK5142905.1 hypothetical protein LTR32_004856 [Rachicladosporium monterosium]
MPESIINEANLALDRYDGNIFVVTMRKAPENRLNSAYAQKLIGAFNTVRKLLGADSEGAVITKGNDAKFWCTGLELDESDSNPYANSEGFFPLLATIMDFPFPTIALITGHTFGGAGPFALSHDYRVARAMLLEAKRWTGEEALKDGIVDFVAEPDKMLDVALDLARKWAPKAKMGVFSLLRNELYGEAGRAFREISYVHGKSTGSPAKAKI